MSTQAAIQPTTRKRGRGQPSKWNPQMREALATYLECGVSIESACELSGISRATYYNWRRRAEDGEPEYLDFLDTVRQSEAKAEARAVAAVQLQFGHDWRAAMEFLARRFPERWSKTPPPERRDEEANRRQQALIKVSAEIRALSSEKLRELMLELADDDGE